MIIIRNEHELCELLLPKVRYINTEKYRLNYYVFTKKVDSGYLMFNNLTKELLLLTEDEYSEIKSEITNSAVIEYLIAHYFLVKEDTDEKTLSDQIREIARSMEASKGLTGYLIFTTTACNARCFYCFEAGTPIYTMDEKTSKNVADFIIKHHNGNKVHIRWFGGEPLCNTKAIDIICNTLKENDIEFSSDMVTNGYLFDEYLAKHARDNWNQKTAQITLDGNKETYNRVKNYKNGDPNAFDKVCDNILYLLKAGIDIDIRLNLDKHNEDELFSLIDFLGKKYDEYFSEGRISVHTHPIIEDTGYIKTVHDELERHELFLKYKELQEYILSKNMAIFPKLPKTIRTRFCSADSSDNILVSPEGKLGRCEHHANDDFFATIYNYTQNKPMRDYCKPTMLCDKCGAYPSCLRIKGCSSSNDECYEYERYKLNKDIELAMLRAYNNYMENG